jgi:hypothetical protein
VAGVSPVEAQDTDGREREVEVWRLETLRTGFCVQFLVEPAALNRKLPEGARPLAAGRIPDLHPALRSVVEGQPEYAAWTPSHLCLFYFDEVLTDQGRVRDKNPSKAPVLGFWTVAADSSSGNRRDLVLEVFTNSGRLEDFGERAGLDIARMKSGIGPVPPDDEGVSSGDDRYQLTIGKTQLVWDGRPGADSARLDTPLARDWRAQGRRSGRLGGWVNGNLSLSAEWTRAMIGSLKVEGKDDLARLLRASPIRFVGPGYQGGAGSLEFEP